jgi:hypothetical protein
MMKPDTAEKPEEKRPAPGKDIDNVDIPTFLRMPSRLPPFKEVKRRAGQLENANFDDDMPRFLRTRKELENSTSGPDKIQKRIAEMKAIEEDANQHGKDGFCRVCSKAARLLQIGPCVYAKPCGHRQYQGDLH